jgi:O-antigen ligase
MLKNWTEGILLFVILYNLFEEKELCRKAVWGLMALFMFSNITMLLDWHDILNISGIRQNRLGESSGFGNPNDYAAYMLLFFPILFSTFWFAGKKIVRYSCLLGIVVSLMAFLMTGSRGGFLAFMAGSLIYLILINRHILKSRATGIIKYAIMLFVLLLVPIFLLPDTFFEKMVVNLAPEDIEEVQNYSHGRGIFWVGGLKIAADSPIWGHGQKTFPALLEEKEGVSAAPHNRYLLYLVEFGLIGLFAYLLLQFSLLKQAYTVIKFPIDKPEKLYFLNYCVGLISYSMALFFVDGTNTDIPFWIYTASVCRLARFEKIKPTIERNA